MITTESEIRTQRIVSVQRGSWRWQNAYAIATYAVRETLDGRKVWYSIGRSRKMSEPQLRRAGYGDLESGSLHHQPYTP